MTEAYSYEDHESPGLEVVKPDLKPRVPTPPPFGNQSQSPTSDDSKKAGKGRKSRFPKPLRDGEREATAALLQGTIAAFKPEVWRYEKDHPHTFGPFPVDHNYRSRGATNPIKPESTKGELTSTAASALGLLLQESPQSRDPQSHHWKDSTNGPGDPKATPNSDPDRERSHSLSKFLITDPESRNSLPALRDPSTARSPGNAGTTLPPIQTQLGQLAPVLSPPNGLPARIVGTPSYPLPPVTAVSPPRTRAEPSPWEPHRLAPLAPPKIPPSPYSHLSPASSQAISAVSSPVSTQAYWRSGPKPTITYPYDPPSTTSRSPATSYPTPTDHTSTGTCDSANYGSPSQGNLPNAPAGTFKCGYSGCQALPFQTQYLLNSHANVHSQDRPHFCPVDGCSRALGGKGFKRKNEMIRHGLVHNSPGYVCPFCPDQQHKYPRPDNLQRHVRVHHVDKNKDDPALRHVLSQRPEGSGRGRRRRINAQ